MKPQVTRFGVAAVLMLVAIGFWARADDGNQPIAYNHRVHIEDGGMECQDCHVRVEDFERASIPNIEICSDCHDDPEDENPKIRQVAQYVVNGRKIPWKQVHVVRDYALFSHRRHVKLAQIECQVCHGPVETMNTPFEKPFIEITMAWCLECHEKSAAATDCYACHR